MVVFCQARHVDQELRLAGDGGLLQDGYVGALAFLAATFSG